MRRFLSPKVEKNSSAWLSLNGFLVAPGGSSGFVTSAVKVFRNLGSMFGISTI